MLLIPSCFKPSTLSVLAIWLYYHWFAPCPIYGSGVQPFYQRSISAFNRGSVYSELQSKNMRFAYPSSNGGRVPLRAPKHADFTSFVFDVHSGFRDACVRFGSCILSQQ